MIRTPVINMKRFITMIFAAAVAAVGCQQKIEYTEADWVTINYPQDGLSLLISSAEDELFFSWKMREGATYTVSFDDNKEFTHPVIHDVGATDTLKMTAGQLHEDLLTIDPDFFGTKRFFWRVDQNINGSMKHCWRYFYATYAAGSLLDDRDGVTYNTITYEIDEFTSYEVMTENLRASVYADGKPLDDGYRTCNGGPYADDPMFVAAVGHYYTWHDAVRMDADAAAKAYRDGVQVQGICPDGWHLPDYDEMDNLISFFIGPNGDDNEGLRIMTTNYWTGVKNITNELKFNLLPSGQFWSLNEDEEIANVGKTSFLWCSTPTLAETSYSWGVFYEKDDLSQAGAFCIWTDTSNKVYRYYRENGYYASSDIKLLFPVRCIRNYTEEK